MAGRQAGRQAGTARQGDRHRQTQTDRQTERQRLRARACGGRPDPHPRRCVSAHTRRTGPGPALTSAGGQCPPYTQARTQPQGGATVNARTQEAIEVFNCFSCPRISSWSGAVQGQGQAAGSERPRRTIPWPAARLWGDARTPRSCGRALRVLASQANGGWGRRLGAARAADRAVGGGPIGMTRHGLPGTRCRASS